MENESNEIACDVTIKALSFKTRKCLSNLLNPVKIIPTDKGLPRDWQGLAELVGIKGEQIPHLQSESDPTQRVLTIWNESNVERSTIKELLQFLEKLDRFDIIDDAKESIVEDIVRYKEKNSKSFQEINYSSDFDILTVDDAIRIKQGLMPQNYDAFVLFAEDDIAFATELIDTMEKQYLLKLCVKDRDMVGGSVELETIIKLITDRCNRLIVIVSEAFLCSPWNKFFLMLAQKLGIEQRQRRIIPCLYTDCQVPPEISCYFMLNYQKSGKLWNFWQKLYTSISVVDNPSAVQSMARSKSHISNNSSTLPLQQLKPKKECVKFNNLQTISLPTPPDTPILSEASNSIQSIPDESKTIKTTTKHNWLKKILPTKVSRSHSEVDNKEKKKFWTRHIKRKIAVAN